MVAFHVSYKTIFPSKCLQVMFALYIIIHMSFQTGDISMFLRKCHTKRLLMDDPYLKSWRKYTFNGCKVWICVNYRIEVAAIRWKTVIIRQRGQFHKSSAIICRLILCEFVSPLCSVFLCTPPFVVFVCVISILPCLWILFFFSIIPLPCSFGILLTIYTIFKTYTCVTWHAKLTWSSDFTTKCLEKQGLIFWGEIVYQLSKWSKSSVWNVS